MPELAIASKQKNDQFVDTARAINEMKIAAEILFTVTEFRMSKNIEVDSLEDICV